MREPCYGCTTETGRSPECHCWCQRYLDYRAFMDAARNSRTVEREAWDTYHASRELAMRKITQRPIRRKSHHG